MSNASATSQQAADAILLDARPPQGCWPGDIAVSSVLEGFSVDVSAVFEAGALA